MLSEKLGHALDKPLLKVAKRIPFSPNSLTIAGFLVTLIASVILTKNFFAGGILVLAGALLDVIDGVVARVNNKSSQFGAFLDSVLDRYSDAAILLAIAWNFYVRQVYIGVLLGIGTMVGAFLISYTRARAEGLGQKCKYGLMERPERIIAVAFGCISGLMLPVLWIMIFLTHFTVIQRIYYVWSNIRNK